MAQIGGAHGLKGEVRLWSHTEEPSAIARYGALETEDGSRRLAIIQLRPAKDHFVARLHGVDDRDAAEALRNVRLYVAREHLPETEDDDTFYHADLIGLAAFDPGGEKIGEVIAVQNFGAGDIIEVRRADGGTTLYPFHAAVVPEIDVAAGRLTIVAPIESGDEAEERSASAQE